MPGHIAAEAGRIFYREEGKGAFVIAIHLHVANPDFLTS